MPSDCQNCEGTGKVDCLDCRGTGQGHLGSQNPCGCCHGRGWFYCLHCHIPKEDLV